MSFDPSLSNSLADLAAKIRSEHADVIAAAKRGLASAIAAGDLLIEAKVQLKHGKWLPWLKDHCMISERTAQLYMRVARNRTEIEGQMRNGAADLSLNEAAALLMLSSDVRRLVNFAKGAEGLSGEGLVNFCIANDVAVFRDQNYDPFAGRSEAEQLEWLVFAVFLSFDLDAGRGGMPPEGALNHVEYLLQRPFQNVAEWLGPEGEKWRRAYGLNSLTEEFNKTWVTFRDQHQGLELSALEAELGALQGRFERDRAARNQRKPARANHVA